MNLFANALAYCVPSANYRSSFSPTKPALTHCLLVE
jgi:hypothetical protein